MLVMLTFQLFSGVWSEKVASRVCHLFAVVNGNLTILSIAVDGVVKHLAYNGVVSLDIAHVVFHVVG